jgi:hypothetical protein
VSVSVSLVSKCITIVTFVLPEVDNKSLLVGFQKLGFSLAGCQNSWCVHVFCDCCSLLFSAAIFLVMCVSTYDIAECGLLHIRVHLRQKYVFVKCLTKVLCELVYFCCYFSTKS